MPKVIMLGAGPLQVPAIKSLKRLGCEVVCVDYDAEAVGFALADRHEIISTLDVEAVYELAKHERADFVITSTTDAPVRTAAIVSERLGLFSGITPQDAVCATCKDAMRDRLARCGVPVPGYRACASEVAFSDALEAFGWNCVVKPADSAASRGVVLVDTPLSERGVAELFARELPFSRKGVLMVEERMEGPEVSVETLTVAGKTTIIAVTDKLVTEPPYFVELGHTEQTRLPQESRRAIERVACEAIRAIGITQGPSHTEIIVTEDGPKIVEIAARLGGDYITSWLVPLSTGIDLVDASVRAALDMPIEQMDPDDAGAAIRFITSRKPGRIASISVDPSIEAIPGFVELDLYLHEGDAIASPHSSNDRMGHVICSGVDAAAAARSADRALACVSVSVTGEGR